jgi:hypothetical protein
MAQQGMSSDSFELHTTAWGSDGYVMEIRICGERRRVFFDAAGRVTHVRVVDIPLRVDDR